jgi:DNA polymerase-1
MSKLAAILFNRAVKANKLDATLINMVHDELVVETKKEIAEQVLALLVQCMEDAGKVFIKKLPIEASGKISEFWAH